MQKSTYKLLDLIQYISTTFNNYNDFNKYKLIHYHTINCIINKIHQKQLLVTKMADFRK